MVIEEAEAGLNTMEGGESLVGGSQLLIKETKIVRLRLDAEALLRKIAVAFKEADVDRSGFLDADELAAVMKAMYRKIEGVARGLAKVT